MISFRMIALMIVIASVSACWPRATDEVEVLVEEAEEVVEVEGVSGSDELQFEIVEEVE